MYLFFDLGLYVWYALLYQVYKSFSYFYRGIYFSLHISLDASNCKGGVFCATLISITCLSSRIPASVFLENGDFLSFPLITTSRDYIRTYDQLCYLYWCNTYSWLTGRAYFSYFAFSSIQDIANGSWILS